MFNISMVSCSLNTSWFSLPHLLQIPEKRNALLQIYYVSDFLNILYFLHLGQWVFLNNKSINSIKTINQ